MDPTGLRLATQAEHQRLEQKLDLLSPSLNLEQYVHLLRRFYGFYKGWEPKVAERVAVDLPELFDPRRKLPLLETDLLALGSEQPNGLADQPCLDVLELDTLAGALGSMYVSEGSTLGGQLLSPHFRKQLHIDAGSGCAFFAGYGDLTFARWRAFQAVLRSRPPSDDKAIIDSALTTFRLLYDWLPEAD